MNTKLQAVIVWVKDHFMLGVLAGIAIAGFFFFSHFQELFYGLIRIAIGVLILSLVLYLWFKDTVREYLVSGNFVADFKALEAKHRVAVTLSVIFFIGWVTIECLIHP